MVISVRGAIYSPISSARPCGIGSEPMTAIRTMLAAAGTAIPASGRGAVNYVIAAYNDFETVDAGGASRQLFGLEWGYDQACPATRRCAPSGFDAAACFGVRTDQPGAPAYALRCLSGPQFQPDRDQPSPVRSGQAFVAVRTIKLSPFGDGRIYYGGYDNDFSPADGAAWIAASTQSALRPAQRWRPVGGNRTKPMARVCTAVLAFPRGRAGTDWPRRPTQDR